MHDSVHIHGKQHIAVDWKLAMVNNDHALFNSGASFDRLNTKADSRPAAIFTSVRNTIGTPSMSGLGVGYLRVCRFLCAGLSTHALCPAPPFDSGGSSLMLTKEATMPSISRALSRLFPSVSVAVSTLPTLAEARALSALLVSHGKRVCIQSAAQGFTVSEVKA